MKSVTGFSKDRLRKILPYFFMVYLIIQPFLDTIYLFSDQIIAKFGVSPSTVIRFLGIAVLSALTLVANGWKKKYWWAVGYLGVVTVYFVFHCLYARNFHSLVPGNFNYSVVNEFEYLLRLLLPLLLILLLCNISFDDKIFKTTVLILTLTISGLIVITNLFCVSLDSYTNQTITGNFFFWFGSAYRNSPINGFASKAFFSYANQVSVILCMLLPITISLVAEGLYFIRVLALALQCIAMLMLGTRTSAYSCIAILIVMLFALLFIKIVKREKMSSHSAALKRITLLGLSVVICFAILPQSPAKHRSQGQAELQKEYLQQAPSDDTGDSSLSESERKEGTLPTSLLLEKLQALGVNDTFFRQSYPYQYDREFWSKVVKLPFTLRQDNRYMEELMLKRVAQIDGRPFDSFLGLTYSRASHIYNLERDFRYQYYSMGLIGLFLLFSPYFVVLAYGLFYCLRYFKKLFTFWNFSLIGSCALAVGTSYLCGNSMDALFVTTILAMVCSQIIRIASGKEEKQNENIGNHADLQ